MKEPTANLPFTEADVRAAIELFEPSAGAAQLAKEIIATIRLGESAMEEYERDPDTYTKLHPVPSSYTPIPSVALSPDLLVMLSLVSQELESTVRSYIADTGLITGALEERWEASREQMRHALAQRRGRPRT
jgi:hypothetical protein